MDGTLQIADGVDSLKLLIPLKRSNTCKLNFMKSTYNTLWLIPIALFQKAKITSMAEFFKGTILVHEISAQMQMGSSPTYHFKSNKCAECSIHI